MAVTQATSAGRRRLAYGANAAVQIVLILGAVAGLIFVAQRYRGQVDVTRTGINSLTPRTLNLLKKLDQDVRITAIYTVLSEYDQRAQKRQDAVRDLLKLYESAGHGRITADLIDPMKDRAKLPAMLQRLRDLPAYKDEAKTHKEIIDGFPALSAKIVKLAESQAADADRLGGTTPNSILAEISQSLRKLVQQSEDVSARLTELKTEDLPRYGAMVDAIRTYVDGAVRYFDSVKDWVEKRAPNEHDITPDALKFLQVATGDYAQLTPELNALSAKCKDLKPLKMEELSGELNRWSSAPPILVETKDAAEVVAFYDAWPMRQDGQVGPDGDDRDFAGEQTISSAILKLTQKEKTAVIFTRYGGPSPITPDFSNARFGQFPRAAYGVLNDALQKANFLTADWDVQTSKTPPAVEGAVRSVYVVFPPAPPPQSDPRRPTPPQGMTPQDVDLVTKAVDQCGMAIFMTGWTPPSSPIMGGPEERYEYGDYLKSKWGVEVENSYITLPFAASPDSPGLFLPTRETQRALIQTPEARFTSHPIGKPLQAMPTAMDASCPLEIVATATQPAGVKVEPIIALDKTDDTWATKNISRLNEDFRSKRGTTRHDDDVATPFPLAVAAERAGAATTQPTSAPAKPAAQRVVVFASSTFVNNSLLEMPGGFMLTSGGLQSYSAFPGNLDLFINALHWVTNDADRISVGATRGEIPRLDQLKDDAMYTFWKVFLVGIWPATALLVGGGVWLLRRK